MLKTPFFALFLENGKKLVFAMEAPPRIITRVLLPVHLMSRYDLQRNPPALGKFAGRFQLTAWQAGRIRQYRQHPFSQHFMYAPCEERGICSSRVSDQHASQRC